MQEIDLFGLFSALRPEAVKNNPQKVIKLSDFARPVGGELKYNVFGDDAKQE